MSPYSLDCLQKKCTLRSERNLACSAGQRTEAKRSFSSVPGRRSSRLFLSIRAKSLYSYFSFNEFVRFFRTAHRNKLKLDQIPPVICPLFQQARFAALHQLEAAIEVGLHPAFHVREAVRSHAPLLAEAAINRFRVPIPEPLDDHVEHKRSLVSFCE